MKDIDLKKECEIENFNYSSCWDDNENKIAEEVIKELPRGSPRKGLNGKYLKKKK